MLRRVALYERKLSFIAVTLRRSFLNAFKLIDLSSTKPLDLEVLSNLT